MAQVRSSFARGAAILGVAAFISKILGAVYRIPYQNITGNEGMYVYQQVYPLYSTLLILATAGFPTAISKLVSEKLAIGDRHGARQVFRVAGWMLFATGSIFFLLLFFGAEKLADWMGNRDLLTLPIRSVSFSLLIVPMMSAFRGYFQGHQDMMPTAVSQVVEQLIRVTTILVLSWYFIEAGYGFSYAGAGAVFGATTGAVGAWGMLMFFLRKYRREGIEDRKREKKAEKLPLGRVALAILALAFPVCLGALVLPLYSLVDSFSVANLLVASGWGLKEAVVAKGVFDRGQPLIQFASFFSTAISLSIVPAIAEAKAKSEDGTAKERALLALRLTWMLGLPASVGLAVIALPANVMLFKDASGSDTLAILAFAAFFSTLGHASTGILQGLSRVYLPALTLIAGVIVKLSLNLLLVPLWDIRGAAVSTVIAYGCATLLNLLALKRELDLPLKSETALKTVWAVLWMAAAVFGTMMGILTLIVDWVDYRTTMMVTSLVSVFVGAVTYFWALFRFGVLTRTDLEKVPKLKKRLLPILDKWRLLRS